MFHVQAIADVRGQLQRMELECRRALRTKNGTASNRPLHQLALTLQAEVQRPPMLCSFQGLRGSYEKKQIRHRLRRFCREPTPPYARRHWRVGRGFGGSRDLPERRLG